MSDVPVSLTVTEKTKVALGEASPWIRFLAILGFVGVGVLVLAGILMMIYGGMLGAAFGMGFLGPIVGLIYVALAVVVFFPTRMMLRMAGKTKAYKASGAAADLEGFALNARALAVFYGIMTIIMLALVALMVIISVFTMLMR
jgi:uncharacterized membrane protein